MTRIAIRPTGIFIWRGHRAHHGLLGAALALAGLALAASDWHDRHSWLPDLWDFT